MSTVSQQPRAPEFEEIGDVGLEFHQRIDVRIWHSIGEDSDLAPTLVFHFESESAALSAAQAREIAAPLTIAADTAPDLVR